MELVTVRELFKNREQYLDQKITVGGWIRSIRDSKTFGFIVVNDGSYFEPLQIVYHDTMDNFQEISKQNVGAAIVVTGTLVATPQAKQPFEIQADEVVVEGASNISDLFRICVREPIHFRQYSACALWRHMRSTAFSRRGDLCMCTLR